MYRIRELPEPDRPREKLLELGAENLTDSELLAILIRTGIKGKNALELARETLKVSGGLSGLSRMSVRELSSIKGLGEAKAVTIAASLELGRRASSTELRKVSSPREVYDLLRSRFAFLEREVLGVVTLNAKGAVISVLPLLSGRVNAVSASPKEVLSPVVRDLAEAFILFHNHPSGDPRPSPEDLRFTRRVKEASELLGITLIDHLILVRNGYFSFKEEGLV
ncbi:MAG: DNA repair protein RadC [Desulfurobacteriaceae bacterium]